MANNIVTLKEIARQALPMLRDNLVFPTLIHNDYSDELHGIGDTVRVRKPVVYEAGEFDENAGVTYQDIIEDCVDVTLDHIATVDARASAIEAADSLEDLNRLFVQPAAMAIAEKINRDGLRLYKDIYAYTGTAGTVPSNLSALAEARKVLNNAKTPVSGRCAVWDVDADASLSSIEALVNAEKSGSNQALREGAIGRVYGIDNYMSQGVHEHITGITAATSVKINGAVQAGADTISIDGATLTGKLVAGDIISVGGRSYVVTEDTANAVSNAISNIKISPAAAAMADNAEVTLIGDHTANLIFHPMAFAYVTRPLANPDGQGVESYVTNYGGLSLRVTRGYDQQYKRSIYSMDVLYGFKTVYPQLAVRVLG